MPTPLEIIPSVEATPIVDEPKLVEENVPIKKYYGRKRDDQSSSEDSDYSYDVNIVPPTNTTKYLFRVHNSVHWIFIYSFCFFSYSAALMPHRRLLLLQKALISVKQRHFIPKSVRIIQLFFLSTPFKTQYWSHTFIFFPNFSLTICLKFFLCLICGLERCMFQYKYSLKKFPFIN